MRMLLALFLLLAGCGGSEDNNNHGYGWEFDAQGTSGLRLRHSTVLQTNDQLSNVEYYERAFFEVSQCSGMDAPAPFVIVVPRATLGGGIDGVYHSNPSLIIVGAEVIKRAIKHEYLHYLLQYTTGDADGKHTSPLFFKCALVSQ